ncbi:MAG: hypothetical protein K9J37_14630 [Saprospiraceae bacterium]|nr:hypothetical protein [Saprospiraceae bacterium]MCF8251143.1 hypothetical protein [Saprospiraceae bacterium]MCF8281866.1 hypothetical protein [Bacteroidales bacterium]MCF8312955.1 hypothetical protein [Saprospiraceae bacterium]MCF8441402.1 hypothetical protein [Saprospiraceae bacterium]
MWFNDDNTPVFNSGQYLSNNVYLEKCYLLNRMEVRNEWKGEAVGEVLKGGRFRQASGTGDERRRAQPVESVRAVRPETPSGLQPCLRRHPGAAPGQRGAVQEARHAERPVAPILGNKPVFEMDAPEAPGLVPFHERVPGGEMGREHP